MICLQNVSLGYKKDQPILENINLNFQLGKFYIICGPSGAGKSTLLDSISGYNKPLSGKLVVDEIDIFSLSHRALSAYRKKKLSYLPQEQCLIESINVLNNICLPRLINEPAENTKKIIHKGEEYLKKMGIESLSNKFPRELSGGEIKRTEILQQLLKESPIILLDEPTNNLDNDNVAILIELLKEKCRDGKLIIVSTHDERLMNIDGTRRIQINNKMVKLCE